MSGEGGEFASHRFHRNCHQIKNSFILLTFHQAAGSANGDLDTEAANAGMEQVSIFFKRDSKQPNGCFSSGWTLLGYVNI